jgi:hypothetical protein
VTEVPGRQGAQRKRRPKQPVSPFSVRWSWALGPGHFMDVSLSAAGLRYVGADWSIQTGGPYGAGFQSFVEFDRDGGHHAMPPQIGAEIRSRIAGLPRGIPVCIRLDGDPPTEAHYQIDDEEFVRMRPEILFDGALWEGAHRIKGLLLFAGADGRRRRLRQAFEQEFAVTAPTNLIIMSVRPG